CGPLDERVRIENATVAQFDIVTDDGVGSDSHTAANPGARRNDRARVDFIRSARTRHGFVHRAFSTGSSRSTDTFGSASRSTIMHMSVASAARTPSTDARPSSLQKF